MRVLPRRGGGLGLASVVTVWKVEGGMTILHEVSVGVGPPVLMTDTDGQRAKANLNRFWFAVDLILSWLEAKAPMQVDRGNERCHVQPRTHRWLSRQFLSITCNVLSISPV